MKIDIEKNDIFTNSENNIFWGTALWIFFHVLANKIKPELFHIIRLELLQNIQFICNNIHCNICREHSTKYLEKHNFMQIKTVEELKLFFFIFHNSVNFENNKELFLFEKLDKYNDYKLDSVLASIFKYNYIFNIDNEIIDTLKIWFYSNIDYFN
jgi:hypothetical protein